jgi:hypothetical protein
MSQRFNSGYGLGGPAPYGASQAADPQQGEGFLDQIRPYTSKIEDALDTFSEPIKP